MAFRSDAERSEGNEVDGVVEPPVVEFREAEEPWLALSAGAGLAMVLRSLLLALDLRRSSLRNEGIVGTLRGRGSGDVFSEVCFEGPRRLLAARRMQEFRFGAMFQDWRRGGL